MYSETGRGFLLTEELEEPMGEWFEKDRLWDVSDIVDLLQRAESKAA